MFVERSSSFYHAFRVVLRIVDEGANSSKGTLVNVMNTPFDTTRVVHRLFVVCLTCAMGLGAWSPVALAQESDDASSQKERATKAKKAFESGISHSVAEEYADAIVDFKRAQQFYPSATLLYNIALARARLGQTRRAARIAQRALDFEGSTRGFDTKSQTKARAMVDGGGVLSAARQNAEQMAASKGRSSSKAGTPTSGRRGGRVDRGGGASLGALGWSGVATTVVGIGGIVGVPIMANRYEEDLGQLKELRDSPDRATFESKRQEAQQSYSIGRALMYAGPTVAALGVGMIALDLFVFRGDRASARMGVTPTGRWTVQMQW